MSKSKSKPKFFELAFLSKKELEKKGFLLLNLKTLQDLIKIAEKYDKPIFYYNFNTKEYTVKMYITFDGDKIIYTYMERTPIERRENV